MREEIRKPMLLTCLMFAATLLLLAVSMAEYRALKAQAAIDTPFTACAGAPTWCQVTSPNVNSTPHEFEDLVVFTNTHLMAVGTYSESDPGGLLNAQEYQNGIWTSRSPANPGPYNSFSSVAATSANNAFVVGNYYSGIPNFEYTLARRWSGGSAWSNISSSSPGTVGNAFGDVSLLTSSTGWAVGAYNDGYVNVSLAEYCNRTCTMQPVPSFSAQNNVLTAVAAISSTNVWAVGSYVIGGSPYHRRPIVLHYTGTWTIPTYQFFTTESFLNDVDYYAANDVWMVGGYQHSPDGSFRPLVAHWDGSSVSFATDINPFGSGYTVLNHVFVTNEHEVWAVGEHRNTTGAEAGGTPIFGAGLLPAKYQIAAPTLPISGSQTFVMHWNGSALNEYNGPYWDNPASDSPGTGSHLLSVAAPIIKTSGGKLPITSTWAVGSYINGSIQARTLVENIAAPNPPQTSISYYVNDMNPDTFYGTGYCAVSNSANGIVILDYGRPIMLPLSVISGTRIFDANHTPYSTYSISKTVESFINGYDAAARGNPPPPGITCPPSHLAVPPITVAVGTSNDVETDGTVNGDHARAWASMVKDIQNYATSYPEVTVSAAIDIEPGFGRPTEATNWVSAYDAVHAGVVYNYGSTNNYPCQYPGMPLPGLLQCAGIGGEWTAEKFYTVSYGIQRAHPLPQIYHNSDPMYWYQVSRWGVINHGQYIRFAGELTECGTSNCGQILSSDYTPTEGWQSLWLRLNADNTTKQGVGNTDMQWSNDIQCIEPLMDCNLKKLPLASQVKEKSNEG